MESGPEMTRLVADPAAYGFAAIIARRNAPDLGADTLLFGHGTDGFACFDEAKSIRAHVRLIYK